LSGTSEKQVPIQFTGLRPGEKLFEELFYEEEEVNQTSFSKLKRARGILRDWDVLLDKLEELEAALLIDGRNGGPDFVRAKIKEIVPEYRYVADSRSEANEKEEKWPASFGRSVA
ncbi:MAG: polysaccharide biosynthesis protein, partial [Terriglobales bacterium]